MIMFMKLTMNNWKRIFIVLEHPVVTRLYSMGAPLSLRGPDRNGWTASGRGVH